MSLHEEYEAIIARLHLPDNWEKYNAANIYRTEENGGEFLSMHLDRIRKAFDDLDNENSTLDPEQHKRSISNEIEEVNTYLDKHGWK